MEARVAKQMLDEASDGTVFDTVLAINRGITQKQGIDIVRRVLSKIPDEEQIPPALKRRVFQVTLNQLEPSTHDSMR